MVFHPPTSTPPPVCEHHKPIHTSQYGLACHDHCCSRRHLPLSGYVPWLCPVGRLLIFNVSLITSRRARFLFQVGKVCAAATASAVRPPRLLLRQSTNPITLPVRFFFLFHLSYLFSLSTDSAPPHPNLPNYPFLSYFALVPKSTIFTHMA
ncbi:hypothetical protein ElyMa_003038500 [Elysia marginata]|uniref:Uncharacterized protein n=1 Tax=Elysia marginata TaxID=1093978 RepID=A0AAV4IIX2_9GAST|nr:hypothetical protein ElyMa_003038500 [Elysia marginata]